MAALVAPGAPVSVLIEYGLTREVFERPSHDRTEQYVSGRFG